MATEVDNHREHLLRGIQRDIKGVREGINALTDQVLRQGERMSSIDRPLLQVRSEMVELRSDLESRIKLEIGGSLAHFETRIETKFAAFLTEITDRIGKRSAPAGLE